MRWSSKGQTQQRGRGHAFPESIEKLVSTRQGPTEDPPLLRGLARVSEHGMRVAVCSADPADAPHHCQASGLEGAGLEVSWPGDPLPRPHSLWECLQKPSPTPDRICITRLEAHLPSYISWKSWI